MVTEQAAKFVLPIVAFALVSVGYVGVALADPQTAETPAETPADAAATGAAQAAPTGQTAPAPVPAAAPVATGQTAAMPVAPVAPESPAGPQPRVYHAAVYSAPPSEPLAIKATYDHPHLIRRVVAVVTTAAGAERIVEFKRGDRDQYVAVVPADLMKAPGIAYAIELELVNGSRVAAFASRTAPHPVTVIEDLTDTRERALLARLGGRRSVITAAGEYVGFGENKATSSIPCTPTQEGCGSDGQITPAVNEQYYRIEAGYTYRSLRTVSEFGFRLGVLRGQSLKSPRPLETYDEEKYDVGLNFGAARVRFRILDLWQMEGELLTSITEEGFSAGVNVATHIGDPYGTKLILGFERLGLSGVTFGNRFYSRMDIVGGSRLLISPIIEITDMPNAEAFGVRLVGEVSFKVTSGFSVQLRGGYQARKFNSGGPGLGGSLSYAF
ncbi:MAG: hypothetical protein IPM54_24830 [Polyangiaceae bacterium]|nr:hypothetical protein [Polyangiaceae bacterium]